MANQRVLDALNEQLNMELFSEYFYLSMESYFLDNDLDGFANFFNVQVKEERDHAYKFLNYISRIGGKIILQPIRQPQVDFESPLEVFELALKHEKLITSSIYNLTDLSTSEKDHTTSSFLRWFIDEQSEEEESMDKIVKKLRLLKNDPAGLLIIDQELAQRVYIPPIQNA